MKKMLLAFTLVAVIIFVGLHIVWYIQPSEIKTTQELNQKLYDGQPTIVEFYSNL